MVVSFENRYRNDAPTHDIRAIITSSVDAQTIVDEWKAGEATEESFIALGSKYDENGMEDSGFLYQGMSATAVDEKLGQWLVDGREAGDVTAIHLEDLGYYYTLYYVGENDAEWYANIQAVLANESMNSYMEEIGGNYSISDPDKNLNYLTVTEE